MFIRTLLAEKEIGVGYHHYNEASHVIYSYRSSIMPHLARLYAVGELSVFKDSIQMLLDLPIDHPLFQAYYRPILKGLSHLSTQDFDKARAQLRKARASLRSGSHVPVVNHRVCLPEVVWLEAIVSYASSSSKTLLQKAAVNSSFSAKRRQVAKQLLDTEPNDGQPLEQIMMAALTV